MPAVGCFSSDESTLTWHTQLSTDALIAQKRAEVAAKVAAISATAGLPLKPPGAFSSSAPSKSTVAKTPSTGASTPGPGPLTADAATPNAADMARRVAEAKRRVAEAQTQLAVKDNPYMVFLVSTDDGFILITLHFPQSVLASGKKGSRPPEPAQQGAGLKMAAHPLLLDNTPVAPQSKKDKYKPMQPKFASIKVPEFIFNLSWAYANNARQTGEHSQCTHTSTRSNTCARC